jgi:hypothetical protein
VRAARPGRETAAELTRARGVEAKAAGTRDWSRRLAINSWETALRLEEMARVKDEFFAGMFFMGENSFAVPRFSPKLRAVWIVLSANTRDATGVRPGRFDDVPNEDGR